MNSASPEITSDPMAAHSAGMDSAGPQWLYECEVRSLAMRDEGFLFSFFDGASRHRPAESVERLKADVYLRKEAMAALKLSHPYIDMSRYLELYPRPSKEGETVSATEAKAEPDLFDEPAAQQAAARQPRQSVFARR